MMKFHDYEPFSDGEIKVAIREKNPADVTRRYVPAYRFDIIKADTSEWAGIVELRIGDTNHIKMYGGHIGYAVSEKHRGHRYSARACELIKPVALDYGFRELWITCNPDNIPSRRTCEILGCELVEMVDLPPDTDMYQRGERQKCRYRWDL